MKRLLVVTLVLGLNGCAHIATVKPTTPHLAANGTREPTLVSTAQQLREAQEKAPRDPLGALGEYLAAAQTASSRLTRYPDDRAARDLYNFSVARAIGVIEDARLNPWDHALTVPGPTGDYILTTKRQVGTDRDPAAYEIIPSDSLTIGGAYLRERVTISGVGAPVVAVGREEKKDFREKFASRRLYAGATGIIRFRGHFAELEFFQPLVTDRVSLDGHSYPLAADITAPLAVGLTRERPEKLGLSRLLRPEKYADTARLTRLQVYDPKRIPVIFVHGLQDTPASWTPLINALYEDPEIRRRYQFWVYSYPSGYPYPYSAALFRAELDGVDRAFPDHTGIVLIGHSMGGMISRLMITDADQKIWDHFFGKPPSETALSSETRELLVKSLIFNHRPEVKRVIFMSTPHRGSDLASNWMGRFAATFVKIPLLVATVPITAITAATQDPGAVQAKRLPNSIDTLSPHNRFVLEVNKLPITPGIPYHSIIGDRGHGDTPNSSDGVVAYWSSHLDGAQSELIVPSNHSSPANPEAIAEVRRILRLHLKGQGQHRPIPHPDSHARRAPSPVGQAAK
jgi:pimeloyl-ACP methyl ester carboxylesterase